MGLSNDLSCETGSFSCHCNPHTFLQQVLRFLFLSWNPRLHFSLATQFLPVYLHVNGGPPGQPAFHPLLSISAPPTSLDECFFFIFLVVGLPYNSVFCQFGYFLFLNVLFFWLCEEAKCIYLCLHHGWKSYPWF